MVVVDTSALIAILRGEPEASNFLAVIPTERDRMISALTWYETLIVAEGARGSAGVTYVRNLVADNDMQIMPFDAIQAGDAHAAYQSCGKGHHPAKRDDFAKTDMAAAASS